MTIQNLLMFAGVTLSIPWDFWDPIVILYFGPETILPVASFIAGVVGVIMMFWRYIIRFIRKRFNRLFGRHEPAPEVQFTTEIETQDVSSASTGEN